jgi:hypothetical protein
MARRKAQGIAIFEERGGDKEVIVILGFSGNLLPGNPSVACQKPYLSRRTCIQATLSLFVVGIRMIEYQAWRHQPHFQTRICRSNSIYGLLSSRGQNIVSREVFLIGQSKSKNSKREQQASASWQK